MAQPDPTSFLPLPQAQFHVLVALTEGERHGYAIMQAVETSSGGVVRMGPATLYGTLKRLVDQHLAEELARRPAADDDQRRRGTTASLGSASGSAQRKRTGSLGWCGWREPTCGPDWRDMADRHPLYRGLVRLYPGQFRRDYGDDLVQHFADLTADRGTRAAWARTSLDLTITIPRYHLEQIMNDQRSNIALNVLIVLLATGGITGFFVDAPLSPLLLVAAGALAVTQRSALARALRVPDTDRRHRRLKTAASLGAAFVLSYVGFVLTVGDSWTITDTLLTLVGTLALVGAVGYLIAGLATPRTPDRGQLAETS